MLRNKIYEQERLARSIAQDIEYIDGRLRKWKYDPQKLIDGRPRKIGFREEDQQAKESAISSRNQARDDKEKKIHDDINGLLSDDAFKAYVRQKSPVFFERLDKWMGLSNQADRTRRLKNESSELKRYHLDYRRSRPEHVGKNSAKIQKLIEEINLYFSNPRLVEHMRGVKGYFMSNVDNAYDHEMKAFEYRRDSSYFNLDERVDVLKKTLKDLKAYAVEASPPIKVSLPK